MSNGHSSVFEQLREKLQRDWSAIRRSHEDAIEVQEVIRSSLEAEFGRLSSTDAEVIVFGSLARREWTSGSDVDWTLLVDGQAKAQHWLLAKSVDETLRATHFRGKQLPAPGGTGTFGNIAFSHQIIHHIGGPDDTNRNTTQRILLLLESCPVRASSHSGDIGAHDRVIRAVLERYLRDDTNFASFDEGKSKIPRFLLNDIVRFWRTMCVDFAAKQWQDPGTKWGLRNIKLRMARKLLFVSGLLTIFSCYDRTELAPQSAAPDEYIARLQDHLIACAAATPMEIVASELARIDLHNEAGKLFDHYDRYLAALNDEEVRSTLERLHPKDAYADPVFQGLRDLSHEFQSVLSTVFFDAYTPLRAFNRNYGVF